MKRVLFLLMLMVAPVALAEVRVSLLTALPGSEIYELEGHTGLRLRGDGIDIVANWGVFDFNQPNFVARFVAGQTDYLCAAEPTYYFLLPYRMQGRRVIEQELELDSVQAATLLELVEANLRPENRVYRYNYVLDNCATRPLKLVETALGHPILSDSSAHTTFRREMRRYHRNYPWYQFGIDLALGRGIDRPISAREAAFAPVTLFEQLRSSGFVREEHAIGEQTLETKPTPWLLTPMAAALLVLLLAIAVTVSRKGQRIFDTALFGINFLTGCLLAYLVFVSTHEATSPNLLLLWLNPFCVFGAVLPWIKSAKKLKICYFFANFALLIVLCTSAPAFGRSMNAAFWPLIAADALRSISNIMQCKRTTP